MAPGAKRRCKGHNAAGEPCGAHPLKDGDYCLSHDAEARASVGFTAEAGRLGGRPRNPRPSEVARELIERNVLALQRPYWRALGYDVRIGPDGPFLEEIEGGGAKLAATFEGDVMVSDHDDLAAMIAAAEKLQDRVYGKPTQSTQVSGPDGGPLEIVDTSNPETVAALHALLGHRPAAS